MDFCDLYRDNLFIKTPALLYENREIIVWEKLRNWKSEGEYIGLTNCS